MSIGVQRLLVTLHWAFHASNAEKTGTSLGCHAEDRCCSNHRWNPVKECLRFPISRSASRFAQVETPGNCCLNNISFESGRTRQGGAMRAGARGICFLSPRCPDQIWPWNKLTLAVVTLASLPQLISQTIVKLSYHGQKGKSIKWHISNSAWVLAN